MPFNDETADTPTATATATAEEERRRAIQDLLLRTREDTLRLCSLARQACLRAQEASARAAVIRNEADLRRRGDGQGPGPA